MDFAVQVLFICDFHGNRFIWNYVMAVSCAWQSLQLGAERRSPTHLTRLQTKSLYLNHLQKVCWGRGPPVAELQEVVRRLHNFREAGKELDGWFQGQPAVCHTQTQKLPHHAHTEGRKGVSKAEQWTLEMTRTCWRKRLPWSLRCPCRTTSALCKLEREGPSHQERGRSWVRQPHLLPG